MAPEPRVDRALRHPQVRALISRFLDLLDAKGFHQRDKRLVEPLPGRHLPDLKGSGRPGDDQILWQLLQELAAAGVIRIGHRRKLRPGDDPWRHGEVEFLPEGEEPMREVLGRPALTPWAMQWREAVAANRHVFANPEQVMNHSLRQIHGLSAETMIKRLAGLPDLIAKRRLTAYQLGALLFDGDSKTLAGKEEWLEGAFGLVAGRLIERPVLIELHLSKETPAGMLLIENLDSYLDACAERWPGTESMALVYTAGFRGTAARIRSAGHARFHVSAEGATDPAAVETFVKAWSCESDLPWPVYFFGDLDWSGLAMFSQLTRVFSNLQPWRPGYEALLEARRQGVAHGPESAGKSQQAPVANTGDPWLDKIASELARAPKFVDQEVTSTYLRAELPVTPSR